MLIPIHSATDYCVFELPLQDALEASLPIMVSR